MPVERDLSSPTRGRESRQFRLSRFFSFASLIGIVAVTVCLLWTYRDLTERHLVEHESRASANLTRAFANDVWGRYRGLVVNSAGQSRESLLANPALQQLRAEVLTKMRGLQVVKIKIYSLEGLTVFSTDDKQIGENKSSNPGFLRARAGEVASQITFREKFDAFEGELNNRNLIASYVPARAAADSPIEGVFEVYSDVTELMHSQSRAQWQVAGVVFALLAALYLFLFLVVRKADRIMARQEQERAAKEDQVRHQAYHDGLTGLPNRAFFSEQLSETVEHAARTGQSCALMFIDLDRFKLVNDSLGHEAGDSLLKVVSKRIHACLRGGDRLFRVGGDEFTIILSQIASSDDAAHVAQRIHEAVASPVSLQGQELAVGATIGIAVYPADGSSPEDLLKNADAAMYSAKSNGRGGHAFYGSAMNQRAAQRLGLEVALKRALRDGEFTLYYQPRLDAAQRTVVAMEALLRWIDPSRGVVAPGEFIGVLEDTGLMKPVGEWVLRTACTQINRWQAAGAVTPRVSVNVSSVQLQSSSFLPMVRAVLRETGTAPELIELELTESVLMADVELAKTTMRELRALGLKISIDDFGTGYSSLNYLRQFPVDVLKIDRSFVTDIANSARDRAVAVAIIDLAKALDITVVAEGVETEAQATFFADIGCNELQGFLFCRPLPPEQLQRHLAPASVAVAGPRGVDQDRARHSMEALQAG